SEISRWGSFRIRRSCLPLFANLNVAEFERCVPAFADMGRYRVVHCVISRNIAAGGGNCTLCFVSFNRYRRTDLFLLSVGFVASGGGFRRDSAGALGSPAVIYRSAAAHGDMAFPLSDLPVDVGIRRRETSQWRSHVAQPHGVE